MELKEIPDYLKSLIYLCGAPINIHRPMINSNFFHITRFPSHEVQIGNRPVGGKQPIRLQSMTNTNTLDIPATIAQSIRIIEAGADYVRISAPNIKAAEALKEIKSGIRKAGYDHPLIADIHFNAEVALVAARYVEKVRINPGNYTGSINTGRTDFSPYEIAKEKEHIYNQLKPLIDICRENGTAIRIGTNLGSLSARIIAQYGNTPKGMVEATYEFLEIFRDLLFNNLVISLKASKPMIMVQAYEQMVLKMLENGMSYPLHIGITEAGEGENGRIKSALGICSLLNKGIGDTLRVSLTEEPENEIPFANKLSSLYQIPFTKPEQGDDFKLTPFHPDPNPILISSGKHKAVVICESEKKPCNEKNETILKPAPQSNLPHADYYFTTQPDETLENPSCEYIIPVQHLEGKTLLNVTPVVDYLSDASLQNAQFAGKFMLRVCLKDFPVPPLIEPTDGLTAIVLDFNHVTSETRITKWIEYSQKYRIPVILRRCFQTAESSDLISHFATFAGNLLLERKIQGIWFNAPALNEDVISVAYGFLQSAGLRITRTEFIACPTCARTSYDLQKVLKDVQKHTSRFPGLKIAVMGCIVNGPGEMADADFGFVGTGTGKLHLYQGRKPVRKNIEPRDATSTLLELLRESGYDV